MVHSTYRIGVALSYSQVRGGLRITGNVYHNGCGKGAGSGAVTYIKGDWTYIRYTQEFRGTASCWKIFGGPASPKYRNKEFAFYPNPYLKNPPNNVHDLDVKVGDGIFNELRMNTRSRNAFDGRVYRCDNEATNFWHGRNGGGLRSATVMLRRSNVRAKAGMLTETSCGTPTYVIKDIWVLM
ncbi:uncharacterized protein LOC110249059 [Exaiptasia diaphana]|uniref:Uncharacterized protein n=1 Tax=Exaiptasia diaphana TaxID=2652724 RepID=A0A913XX82_EXADI|nr:uncharacterized protein LOC110249059 [Exaiptasia diaphana]